MKKLILLSLLQCPVWAQLVPEVRASIAAGDFARAEGAIASYRKQAGVTPEMLFAHSWLGRGALAAKAFDKADAYAAETRKLVLEELKKRPLDAEPQAPLALGASIEVQSHAMAGRNARSEAVLFLNQELKRWYNTSIRTRIQKNLHLLSLEGKPAPPLVTTQYLGARPVPITGLKGKAVLVFFWAHWCADCKQQAPVLTRLLKEYGPKGLVVVGPTQHYGYVAGGLEAPRDQELKYIAETRNRFYSDLEMTVPVSEENFKRWGSSSSPTVVLIDRAGLVRLYNPGAMSYEQLAPLVAKVVAGSH